jgi:hypothetical protein
MTSLVQTADKRTRFRFLPQKDERYSAETAGAKRILDPTTVAAEETSGAK